MTTPDYRALCAELLEQLQRAISEHGFCLEAKDALVYRARTALAQPEPEGATENGIPNDLLRTLLRPAYEPGDGSADGAQLVSLAWWHPVMGCDSLQMVVDNVCAVLARFCRPAIEPVPVSEGLPEPEDCAPWTDEPDCDPWCWAAKDIDGGWEWTQLSIGHFSSDLGRVCRGQGYTHWLPHHALPVPEVTP